MNIRVFYRTKEFIDYEGVDSFSLQQEGWLILYKEGGDTHFINKNVIDGFRHIHE